MKRSGHYRDLMLRHEVLKARVELRDHYLRIIIREVYENIGQVLSLVRIQLSMTPPGNTGMEKTNMDQTGNLVGQAIRDLRGLCEKFYLHNESFTPEELIHAIGRECNILFHGTSSIEVKNQPAALALGTGLISFYIVKSILKLVKEDGELTSMEIFHDGSNICFDMRSASKHQNDENWHSSYKPNEFGGELSVFERIKLVGGRLQVKTTARGKRRIKLAIPYN